MFVRSLYVPVHFSRWVPANDNLRCCVACCGRIKHSQIDFSQHVFLPTENDAKEAASDEHERATRGFSLRAPLPLPTLGFPLLRCHTYSTRVSISRSTIEKARKQKVSVAFEEKQQCFYATKLLRIYFLVTLKELVWQVYFTFLSFKPRNVWTIYNLTKCNKRGQHLAESRQRVSFKVCLFLSCSQYESLRLHRTNVVGNVGVF